MRRSDVEDLLGNDVEVWRRLDEKEPSIAGQLAGIGSVSVSIHQGPMPSDVVTYLELADVTDGHRLRVFAEDISAVSWRAHP